MILHDASSGTVVHEVFFCGTIAHRRHSGFFEVDAFDTKCCSYLCIAVARRYATYTFA